ncbi:MAG TPA: WG repeat-containing protein [Burkholderiaceae bacterium]|nr:WG repeat-containing protein [Burkholderiaceae bacterium]
MPTQMCDDSIRPELCFQSFHDGLAALQLGADHGGRVLWGYIDKSGQLSIAPRFTDAQPFSHGLAAAEDGKHWGYIDKQGNWVIPATYDSATAFGDQGVALVAQRERELLIDRTGTVIKQLAPGTREEYDGFGRDNGVAVLQVPVQPLAWRVRDGKSLALPTDVMEVAPQQGKWIPAMQRTGRFTGVWGYLDASGKWVVPPSVLQATRVPMTDGSLIAVAHGNEMALVDATGKAVANHAFLIRLLAPGVWLVKDKTTARLLADQGKALHDLGDRNAVEVDRDLRGTDLAALVSSRTGIYFIRRDGSMRELADSRALVRVQGHYLFVTRKDAQGNDALTQVLDGNGKPLLDPSTVKQLSGYSAYALLGDHPVPAGKAAFIALLSPADYTKPSALLTSDGRLLMGTAWRTADTGQSMGPLAVVKGKDDKYGVIDLKGNWVVKPVYAFIGGYRDGYALARKARGFNAAVVMLDTQGKEHTIAPHVEQNIVKRGDEVFVYRQRGGDTPDKYGLWRIDQGRIVRKPDLDEIHDFDHGHALARKGKEWGDLDTAGNWQPIAGLKDAYHARRQGDVYVVETRGAQDESGERQSSFDVYSIITRGWVVRDLRKRPTGVGKGRYLVQPVSGGAELVDGRGKVLARTDRDVSDVTSGQGWVVLRSDNRYGAIDAKGNWQVPPVYDFHFSFVKPSMLASVYKSGRYELIDTHGKRVASPVAWAKPVPGMERLVYTDGTKAASAMTTLSGDEVARLPGSYAFDVDQAASGFIPFEDHATGLRGFMDAGGKKVIGAYFSKLDGMVDDRAGAQMKDRYGKYYGFIDRSGRFVIPPRYDWVMPFSEGRAMVSRNQVWSYIDKAGNPVARLAVRCGKVVLEDGTGAQRWPKAVDTCVPPSAVQALSGPLGNQAAPGSPPPPPPPSRLHAR